MWATAETWLEKIRKLLPAPPSDDIYPNDRLPSEQVVPTFALRGFRGRPLKDGRFDGQPVLVAAAPYFDAKPLADFLSWHVVEMRKAKRVDEAIVLRDVLELEQLALSSDAVRVLPTR